MIASANYFPLPITKSILLLLLLLFIIFVHIIPLILNFQCEMLLKILFHFSLIRVLELYKMTFYFASQILLSARFLLKLHPFLSGKAVDCLFVEFKQYFLIESQLVQTQNLKIYLGFLKSWIYQKLEIYCLQLKHFKKRNKQLHLQLKLNQKSDLRFQALSTENQSAFDLVQNYF